MENNYTCYVITNRPYLVPFIKDSISPEKVKFFNGAGYESFSKLVNCCVASCPTEKIIIMSDKVRPTQSDVKKCISLIDKGYGIVALYRFAFFGFKKELFRQVGPFDQRFKGGGGEDDDYCIRLNEANVACYISEEVEYEKSSTTWGGYSFGKQMLSEKWNYKDRKQGTLQRQMPELDWKYFYGDSTGDTFLPHKKSIIDASRVGKWSKKEILPLQNRRT